MMDIIQQLREAGRRYGSQVGDGSRFAPPVAALCAS